ncbi:BrnT family toxin [Rhodopila sp.]|uniref:BrnT family toxin n=1 Tax=Rhodopila sp. TaxID=2480087 RepID=UPI003D10399C
MYISDIYICVIDFALIEGFDWDAGNDRKSAQKHAVSQAEAEQMFFNDPLLLAVDERHGQTESRFHALGRTDDDRRLHVTFTLRDRGRLIRVISARDMHRKERLHYEQTA